MSDGSPPNRIVLSTYGSFGDLFPFLAIGTELRGRGHDVVVATSERYRDTVQAAGLEFAAVRPDRDEGQRDPDFLDRVWRDRQSPQQVFREMFLPGLRESLHDLLGVIDGAGVVVSHTLTPAAPLAAEARGVPWISAVMQPMGYLSVHEPPVIGAPWLATAARALGPRLTASVFAMARKLTGAWLGEWHDLRADLGLPPTAMNPSWDGQHSPRRSLGLFPRMLGEPQPDWPPQARVTGFPFYRPAESLLDANVEMFLAEGEPPMVFTLGATAVNDPGAFYEESAAAVRRLGRRALLLVGSGWEGWGMGATDGLLAVPYAPHHVVFPRAAAIVHQGGIGTLSESILAGKPMLIVPFAHDQFDNAWRADRIGVARRISRRRYHGASVSRALAALLDDSNAAQAAQVAGLAIGREQGATTAAAMVEDAMRHD